MESKTQANFLNHILSFFAPEQKDEGDAAAEVGGSSTASASLPGCPDLPVLLGLLSSSGFRVKYTDKSEWGGTSSGCRAIILCKRSGTRVVMDGEGPCTCPPDETLNKYLHPGAGPASSRAPSPTPSTVGQLEDPLNISVTSTASSAAPVDDVAAATAPAPPPRLNRQRTWSRDADSINNEVTQNSAMSMSPAPGSRRLSAPPGSMSPWATLQGDDLNVLAAADLLQEAMSLLSGVKKVNLRNTPVGPTRRLSAASRRLSTDTFLQPLRPLSRTSSASSGLGSIKSTTSTSSHSDTPRPPRPAQGASRVVPGATSTVGTGAAGAALRRTISANAGAVSTPTTEAASKARTPIGALIRTKSDPNKKGPAEARSVGTKTSLLKPPSSSTKTFIRPPVRTGVKTNATLSMAKTAQVKTAPKSPEMESIKL